jgi:ABC-type transport system substrate-binding protein
MKLFRRLAFSFLMVTLLTAWTHMLSAQPKSTGEVEIVDLATVRVHLKTPWPDFMAFYGATAAGIMVPKKYIEQVGDEGFKKHPSGLGHTHS